VVYIWDMETGGHKILLTMHEDVRVFVTAYGMSHTHTLVVFMGGILDGYVVCCICCVMQYAG
jgi:hypothetical protein